MASAMSHAIHKIVSKNAANLISYRGVRRITAKVKTVICEQAPNHGSYFAYARLIARVTFNLLVFILILRMEICEGGAVRQFPEHPGVDPNEKRNGYSG